MIDNSSMSDEKRRKLEAYLGGQGAAPEASRGIVRRQSREPAPLAPSQKELIRRETIIAGIPRPYNECVTVRMKGSLNVGALKRSFAEIVRRHEIWRTSFEVRDGERVQVVHPPSSTISLPLIDLCTLSDIEREDAALQLIGEDLRKPFDVEAGPLLRTFLVKLSESEHRFYLLAHLSILDGVSAYQVFPSELAAFYAAETTGEPINLPELPIQFGDFATWQRDWMESAEAAAESEYWRKQLSGNIPVLNWPEGRRESAEQTFRGRTSSFSLPGRAEAVKRLSQSAGVTQFAILLAAFVALLHTYTRQEDLIIGTRSPSGRKRAETQGMLGYFLNPVALRFNLRHEMRFSELLRHAQIVIFEALTHDGVPMERIERAVELERPSNGRGLFHCAISLQPAMPQLKHDWSVTSMDADNGGSPWDLYLAFIERPMELLGRVQYNPDVFGEQMIAEMLEQYERLLDVVTRAPEKRLSELSPIVTANMRNARAS